MAMGVSSNNYRLSAPSRVVELLNRGEKSIKIYQEDGASVPRL